MEELEDEGGVFHGGVETLSVLDWGRGAEPCGQVFEETLGQLDVLDRQLLLFCATSSLAAVRWLQLLGASLDAQDANGSTCLHVACRSGALAVVSEVLQHDVLIDTSDVACWTPLHIAAHIGRREAVCRLLQARANPHRRNARGQTPAELCMDHGTLEVIRGIVPPSSQQSEDTVGIPLRCEPECFFVSPSPIIKSTAVHRKNLLALAAVIFKLQPSYGLAFTVLVGVAESYTGAMRTFLQNGEADRGRLGMFLGEGFSLCTLIRFSVFDSMPLLHTGIVSALCRTFSVIQLPQDLQKIERLVRGLSHVWWRKHRAIAENMTEQAQNQSQATNAEGDQATELVGLELKQYLAGSDVVCQLMLSTVLLHWHIHRDRRGDKRMMDAQAWIALNRGIENGGTDVPEHVQVRIHAMISHHFRVELALSPSEDESEEPEPGAVGGAGTIAKAAQPTGSPVAAVTPSPRDEVRMGPSTAPEVTSAPADAAAKEEDAKSGARAHPRQPTPGGVVNGMPRVASRAGLKSALASCAALEGWVKPLDNALPLPTAASSSTRGLCEYAAPSGMSEVFNGPQKPKRRTVVGSEPPKVEDGSVWASLCCIFLLFSMRPRANSSGAPYCLTDARRLRVANVAADKRIITLQGIPIKGAETVSPPITVVVLLSDGRWQEISLKQLEIKVPTVQELNAWVAHLVQWPSNTQVSV